MEKCKCALRIIAFLLPVAIYFSYVYVPYLQTMIYVVPMSILAFMVFLYSWPSVSLALHQKSMTLDDLQNNDDDTHKERKNKELFRKIFTHILIITTSVGVGVIVDFAVIRFQRDSKLSFVEACGVIGGLLTLLKRIHMLCGKILLQTISCFRKCSKEDTTPTQI